MNNSNDNNVKTAALFHRRVSFSNRNRDTAWGFSVHHLLAMRFKKRANEDDRIEFFFSTDTVIIRGRSLIKLWEQVVVDPCIRICVGISESPAYEVKIIELKKEPPTGDQAKSISDKNIRPETPGPARNDRL